MTSLKRRGSLGLLDYRPLHLPAAMSFASRQPFCRHLRRLSIQMHCRRRYRIHLRHKANGAYREQGHPTWISAWLLAGSPVTQHFPCSSIRVRLPLCHHQHRCPRICQSPLLLDITKGSRRTRRPRVGTLSSSTRPLTVHIPISRITASTKVVGLLTILRCST